MSSRVWESATIAASVDTVWSVLRRIDFGWSPRVMSVRSVPADAKAAAVQPTRPLAVGEELTINYRDNTSQRIRLMSLSDAKYSLSWSVVESTPAITYSGVSHTITLRRVTTGAAESTFIEWDSDFSKDASAEVIADARHKQLDNFGFIRAEALKGDLNYTTTAEQAAVISLKAAGVKDIKNQTILITGANTGLGLETARVLLLHGARVIVTVRDDAKAKATVEALTKLVPNAAHKPEAFVCALDSFASIRAFAAAYIKAGYPLHNLILNAGVMALPQIAHTAEKFEMQIGVNHFGHWLLTSLLTPVLTKSAPARVVVLSSLGHQIHDIVWDDINYSKPGAYEGWKAYGASKTANILFAKALNARFAAAGVAVSANSLHPGVILETDLGRHVRGGPPPPYRLKTIAAGAATTIVAALHPKYGPAVAAKDEKSAAAATAASTKPVSTVGGAYLSDCQVVEPVKHARSIAQANKLWELTEKMVAAASK